MKNYICDGLEECSVLEPDVDCIHKKCHPIVTDDQFLIGCNGGHCTILNRDTNCTDIRKVKLDKIKISFNS